MILMSQHPKMSSFDVLEENIRLRSWLREGESMKKASLEDGLFYVVNSDQGRSTFKLNSATKENAVEEGPEKEFTQWDPELQDLVADAETANASSNRVEEKHIIKSGVEAEIPIESDLLSKLPSIEEVFSNFHSKEEYFVSLPPVCEPITSELDERSLPLQPLDDEPWEAIPPPTFEMRQKFVNVDKEFKFKMPGKPISSKNRQLKSILRPQYRKRAAAGTSPQKDSVSFQGKEWPFQDQKSYGLPLAGYTHPAQPSKRENYDVKTDNLYPPYANIPAYQQGKTYWERMTANYTTPQYCDDSVPSIVCMMAGCCKVMPIASSPYSGEFNVGEAWSGGQALGGAAQETRPVLACNLERCYYTQGPPAPNRK